MNRFTTHGAIACTLLVLSLLLAGCRRTTEPETAAEELPARSVTNWTDKTEVFAEHPPLVANQTARFAVHLTTLSDFRALNAGRPTIQLRASDGRVTTFEGTPPLRPGAFRVEGRVPAAGEYRWTLIVDAPGLSDRHELGTITVYPDEETARTAARQEAGAPTISYLKEQQWTNEFATMVVRPRPLRVSVSTAATVAPIAGGEAVVAAPADGRLAPGRLPEIGARVGAGQELARFEPRLAASEDRASLLRDVTEARAAVEAAQVEQDRAERLLAEKAVPARRLDEARRALAVAQARLDAAEARLSQRDQTLARGGSAAGGNTFILRSPIAGRIAQISATPGATFDEGAVLFRVVRTDRVVLQAHVPASDAPRVRDIAGADLALPGEPETIPIVVRSVRHPGVIDPTTRTLILHLTIDNPDGRLIVGQAGTATLYARQQQEAPAIPRTAILTESGRPIVFVQTEGESFEKRRIETGARDGDLVEVRSGLKTGERVVTRGAYEVLLASAARGLPAEGHVH